MITNKKLKMKFKFMILAFLVGITGFAQQDSQFTQYMYNTVSINPAYAGQRDVLSIFGVYRAQWIGLDGAPKTSSISIHSPLNNSKIGLGLSVTNKTIGPSTENYVSGDFSYTIDATDTYKLSFGVKATAALLNIDYTKLDIYNPNDEMFQNNIENQFSPNIGAGVYLHSDNTYVGLSVPNFLETNQFEDKGSFSSVTQRMNVYLIAGHVFDLNPALKFKPSILTKAVKGAPLQVDVSGNFLINDKLTLGLSYRWSASVSALAGFQITEGLFAGYAYDAETTKLRTYNSGSHEIFLRFELFKRYEKYLSPRFF